MRDWTEAVDALLRLGTERGTLVVLDEFGPLLEADRSIESIVATALGPGNRRHSGPNRTRLILCGSAIAMMRALTAGEAPLRGRAGMELVMRPDDFRTAATRLPTNSGLEVAVRSFAVVGGVVGYATDMVNFDLPVSAADFDRWVVERVLSPASPLRTEATTLLAEDPTVAGPGSLLHHSILGVVANGAVTAGKIANRVGKRVSNISPALERLIDAGFLARLEDPLRAQRALYALTDPFLQFHYAVLYPHGPVLRDRDLSHVWTERLRHVFDSRVRGPVFEQMARTWVRSFASTSTLSTIDHLGPSHGKVHGVDHEFDVVVAGPGTTPAERAVIALGEAKAGEEITTSHLQRLELARAGLGKRAIDAKLFLFGPSMSREVRARARGRSDIELVDFERLYHGS